MVCGAVASCLTLLALSASSVWLRSAGSADCDRRQPSEGTATQFPGFDFSEVSLSSPEAAHSCQCRSVQHHPCTLAQLPSCTFCCLMCNGRNWHPATLGTKCQMLRHLVTRQERVAR